MPENLAEIGNVLFGEEIEQNEAQNVEMAFLRFEAPFRSIIERDLRDLSNAKDAILTERLTSGAILMLWIFPLIRNYPMVDSSHRHYSLGGETKEADLGFSLPSKFQPSFANEQQTVRNFPTTANLGKRARRRERERERALNCLGTPYVLWVAQLFLHGVCRQNLASIMICQRFHKFSKHFK